MDTAQTETRSWSDFIGDYTPGFMKSTPASTDGTASSVPAVADADGVGAGGRRRRRKSKRTRRTTKRSRSGRKSSRL